MYGGVIVTEIITGAGLEFLSFAGNLIKDGVNLDLCNLQHLCVLDLACNSLSKLDLTGASLKQTPFPHNCCL